MCIASLFLFCHVSVSKHASSLAVATFARHEWIPKALDHRQDIEILLYGPAQTQSKGKSYNDKVRLHAVKSDPILNFLHTYYRYSVTDLIHYSPGSDTHLIDVVPEDFGHLLSNNSYQCDDGIVSYHISHHDLSKYSKFSAKLNRLRSNFDILISTSMRTPHYGCFGYHEWAMLYSGRDRKEPYNVHQKQLALRIPQRVIDEVVESPAALKCTHFDAWRFFHPEAQPWNHHNSLSRQSQPQNEQPGCLHATMDLFKYAYEIYPLISGELLRKCLKAAVAARVIDMRASPYDVSSHRLCGDAITVETAEGRRLYAMEQEKLFHIAQPVRMELIAAYGMVLQSQ